MLRRRKKRCLCQAAKFARRAAGHGRRDPDPRNPCIGHPHIHTLVTCGGVHFPPVRFDELEVETEPHAPPRCRNPFSFIFAAEHGVVSPDRSPGSPCIQGSVFVEIELAQEKKDQNDFPNRSDSVPSKTFAPFRPRGGKDTRSFSIWPCLAILIRLLANARTSTKFGTARTGRNSPVVRPSGE